jgi:frataxin-like iron-binding protein CyaY
MTQARLQDRTAREFILRPATVEEKAHAALVYERALATAQEEGALSETEALQLRCDTGEWSEAEEKQIKGLQEDIHKLKRGLLDYLFKVEQLEKIRGTIRRAEQTLIEKWLKRESLLNETASHYAEMAQQRFIVGRVTMTSDCQPYWPTEEDFDACTDTALVEHLLNQYFFASRFNEEVIRELARTDPWRSIWMASKHTGILFDGPPGAWSSNQIQLIRWSHIYDVVYESSERPSDVVIEDDDLLDSWIIRQNEKASDYAKKTESQRLLGDVKDRDGRQEVFVVADAEGAKRVYEMNDAQARRVVRTTQEIAANRGEIKDADLPHSQMEIRMKAMARESQHATRR